LRGGPYHAQVLLLEAGEQGVIQHNCGLSPQPKGMET